jgi:hypothetical protein
MAGQALEQLAEHPMDRMLLPVAGALAVGGGATLAAAGYGAASNVSQALGGPRFLGTYQNPPAQPGDYVPPPGPVGQ